MLSQEEYCIEVRFAADRFIRFANQKHLADHVKSSNTTEALSVLTNYENDLYKSLDFIFDNSQFSLPEIYVDIFDEVIDHLRSLD